MYWSLNIINIHHKTTAKTFCAKPEAIKLSPRSLEAGATWKSVVVVAVSLKVTGASHRGTIIWFKRTIPSASSQLHALAKRCTDYPSSGSKTIYLCLNLFIQSREDTNDEGLPDAIHRWLYHVRTNDSPW